MIVKRLHDGDPSVRLMSKGVVLAGSQCAAETAGMLRALWVSCRVVRVFKCVMRGRVVFVRLADRSSISRRYGRCRYQGLHHTLPLSRPIRNPPRTCNSRYPPRPLGSLPELYLDATDFLPGDLNLDFFHLFRIRRGGRERVDAPRGSGLGD